MVLDKRPLILVSCANSVESPDLGAAAHAMLDLGEVIRTYPA